MAIHLYRITQEGLNNIRKHAETSSATVRLVASHPHLILQIEDRGKGFDIERRASAAIREKRMGLQGMTERTALLNGTISVKSQPGKGTKIRVMIPYITKG